MKKTLLTVMIARRHPLLETIASVCGVAGALAVAIPGFQGWGFVLFAFSNMGWLAFSYANQFWKMFTQQLVFMLCSLLGMWNWLLVPLLHGVRP